MSDLYNDVFQIITHFEPPQDISHYFYLDTNANGVTQFNFGFGLDITQNQGDAVDYISEALSEVSAPQATINSVVDNLNDYLDDPFIATPTWIDNLNREVAGIDVVEVAKIATQLYLDDKVADLVGNTININAVPFNVLTALEDLAYNGPGRIANIPGLTAALQASNWGQAAYLIESDSVAQKFYNLGKHGVVYRRDVEAMVMLGFQVSLGGNNQITGLTPVSVNNAMVVQYEQYYQTANPDPNDPNNSAIQSQIISYLASQGYYVPQPGDIGDSDTDTWTNIANHNLNGVSISGSTLQALNAVFPDSSLLTSPTAVVHVPISEQAIGSGITTIFPPSGTYVFDAASGTLYTMGSGLNGQDAGGLYIDTPGIGASGFALFKDGTYNAISYNASTNQVGVTLTTSDPFSDGDTLGTAWLSTNGGLSYFTLTDGTQLPLSAIDTLSNITVSDPTETPLQVLQSYLSDLGYTGTLSTDDFNHLNPPGSAYDVTGTVSESSGVTYDTFNLGANPAPGAVVTGSDDADVNILSVSSLTNITQDTISGIDTLQLNSGAEVELTADQLSSFTSVTGNGQIEITTAGTVDLTSSQFSGTVTRLAAQGWGGSTLIGSDTAGQELAASLFGNDHLTGGNGAGDIYVAGEGVDTILGGTGANDQYDAYDGLASGSSVTGQGTGTLLTAAGDISGASISGIATLRVGLSNNNITMTADQFNGFSDIYANNTGSGVYAGITLNDDGAYTLDGDNVTGNADVYFGAGDTTSVTVDDDDGATHNVTYDATGAGNITLAVDGSGSNKLAADGSGNDTLTAMSGDGNSLSASGSGNDTLTAGDGNSQNLSATGTGSDTLTAGNGTGDSLSASGDGYYTLTAGTGSGDALSLTGDDGSLSASGGSATLNATGSDNAIFASGSGDGITVQGGFNAVTTTGGGATVNLYDTDNDVSGGSSGGNTYNLSGITGSDTGALDYTGLTLNGGTGGGNVLNVDDSTINLTQADISNVSLDFTPESIYFSSPTVIAGNGDLAQLTGLSFAGVAGTVQATEAGTYDVSTTDTTDTITMLDTSTTGNVTLIDNNAAGDELGTAQSGDTLIAGNGDGDRVYADVAGDTLRAGDGDNDSAELLAGNGSATLGNGAGDSLITYGSGATLTAGNGDGDTLEAIGSNDTLTAGTGAGDTLDIVIGNNNTLTAGGSGSTLTASGTGSILTATGSGSTLTIAGAGSSATGTGGDEIYNDNATSGATLIDNYQTGGTASTLNLGSAFTTSNVLVTRSGDNLLLTKSGTSDQVTVENYFEGSDWQVGIDFAGGTDWGYSDVEAMLPSPITVADNASQTITTSGNMIDAGSGTTIAIDGASANSVALSGSGNTVSDDSSSSLNVFEDISAARENTFRLAGTGDAVALAGGGDSTTESGTSETASDTSAEGSNGFTLSGSSDTATLNGSFDTATIDGSGNTATLNNSHNMAYIFGGTASVNSAGTGDTIYDFGTGGNTITFGSSSSTNSAILTGSGDTVIDNGSVNTLELSGSSATITASGTEGGIVMGKSGANITVSGTDYSVYDEGTGANTVNLGGSSNTLTIENGAVSGSDTISGTSDTVSVAGASSEAITFGIDALGTLLLQNAQNFTGTVAGLADGDGIDLTNFDYADGATISSVTGTGAAGTDTIVKITDGTITAQLALMNQFANQFGVTASAYTLTADGTQANAGTLLQLAAAH